MCVYLKLCAESSAWDKNFLITIPLLQVVEGFEESANLAISKAKSALNDPSTAHRLSFIRAHFGNLPRLIEKLEAFGLEVTKAVALIDGLKEQSESWPGPIGEQIRKKLDAVLLRNPGWQTIQNVARILQGEECTEQLDELTPAYVAALKYVPVVSCDVERSFSRLKTILSERRRRFLVENLHKMLTVQSNCEPRE